MTDRFKRHFSALFGGQVLNIVSSVVLLRLFVTHWGVTVYGEWMALSAASAAFTNLDLGMNAAAGNQMLAAYARDDMKAYARYMHSACLFYGTLAVSVTLVAALAVFELPISRWVGIRVTPPATVAWVTLLLIVQVVWSMPVGLLNGVYRTLGNPALSVWIGNARGVIGLVVAVAALALGCDMRTYALLAVAQVAAAGVYFVWDIRRRHPVATPGVRHATVATVREMMKPSLMFALLSVAAAVTQTGTVLIVQRVLGGSAVAVLATSRTLCNTVMQVCNILKNAIWPDLTILYARKEWGRLRAANQMLVVVSSALCIAVGAALWFQGVSVISVWSHGKVHALPLFLHVYLAYLLLQAPWLAASALLMATNHLQRLGWMSLASSLIAVGTAAVLTPRLGLVAIPVALIVGDALTCYHFVIKASCKTAGENYARFALHIWLPGILISAASLVVAGAASRVALGPPELHWAIVGAGTLATALPLMWLFWFNAAERAALRAKLGGRFAPKRPALV